MTDDNRLIYKEPLSVKIARYLKQKGFQAASIHSGAAMDSLAGASCFGVLYQDPAIKQKTYFWGLIKGDTPRRIYLGDIYIDGGNPRSSADHWRFEMYGKEYFEIAKGLASELVKEFNVKITFKVAEDCVKHEGFPSDSDPGW
ncbi:MAG: hypothetical protein M0P64_03375 [Candidatus Pacebacteria bacterium]|jgi:hypothetical protein|nr:hypothetical protein [Candidatus Paceibacterota bacterium]